MVLNSNAANQAGVQPSLIAGPASAASSGYNQISVNPEGSIPAESVNQFLARQGQGYALATGDRAPSTGAAQALSIFNPAASSKTLLIYRLSGYYTTAAAHPVFYLATNAVDPISGSAVLGAVWASPATPVPTPLKAGGAASVASIALTSLTQTGLALPSTNLILAQDVNSNIAYNLIGTGVGDVVVLPAGYGLLVVINWTSTEHFGINAMWSEF